MKLALLVRATFSFVIAAALGAPALVGCGGADTDDSGAQIEEQPTSPESVPLLPPGNVHRAPCAYAPPPSDGGLQFGPPHPPHPCPAPAPSTTGFFPPPPHH